MIFLDAIHYHVREEGRIIKKAVYICMGIDMEGRKDILGLWIGENEPSKFWLAVINDLKNRGVEDILIACTTAWLASRKPLQLYIPKLKSSAVLSTKSETTQSSFHTRT